MECVSNVRLRLSAHSLPSIFPGFRAGDDEGAIEVAVEEIATSVVLNINLLVSGKLWRLVSLSSQYRHANTDTSEYPKSHSFFSYCPDGEPPEKIREALDDMASAPSRPIRETLEHLLSAFVGQAVAQDVDMDDSDQDSDGSADEQFAMGDFDDYASSSSATSVNRSKLQQ